MRGGGRFAAMAGGAQPLTVHSEEGAFALDQRDPVDVAIGVILPVALAVFDPQGDGAHVTAIL